MLFPLFILALTFGSTQPLKCHSIGGDAATFPTAGDVITCLAGTNYCYSFYQNISIPLIPQPQLHKMFGCDTLHLYCMNGGGCYSTDTSSTTCCCNKDACNWTLQSAKQKSMLTILLIAIATTLY